MKRAKVIAGLLFPAGMLAIIHGCGTLGGNPESKIAVVSAPIIFKLTDAPVDDVKNVYITVEALQVSASDGGWVDIPLSSTSEIDLLKLQDGVTTALAELSQLPVGTYKQTRLMLSEASPPRVVDSDGVEHQLKIPSADQTGLKIVSDFSIEENKPLTLVIDFDVRKSLKITGSGNGNGKSNGKSEGKYMMKPVLRMVAEDAAGSISAKRNSGDVVCLYNVGYKKDENSDCDNAVTSAIAKNGAFKAAFLPPGKYDIRVHQKSGATQDVDGVEVVAGKNTDTVVP